MFGMGESYLRKQLSEPVCPRVGSECALDGVLAHFFRGVLMPEIKARFVDKLRRRPVGIDLFANFIKLRDFVGMACEVAGAAHGSFEVTQPNMRNER